MRRIWNFCFRRRGRVGGHALDVVRGHRLTACVGVRGWRRLDK